LATQREVIVKIKADYRAFQADMKAAARAAEQASEKIDKAGKKSSSSMGQMLLDAKQHEKSWDIAGGAMMGFGAAVVGMVGVSVAKYAAFDKAMSRVRAATHASTGDMNLLREAAISAGADTAFSAEEAAQGIEELAKAGVSTQQILAGGLSGALSLAAAGELAVGEAAEIAASALTQFKLSGDQIPHLADLLAAGAGKAQGSVQDMGAALNQSGLVAASTGLTIEETTGALAAFASAGLTGSDAGTSFKTMLQSLNPNSDKAAAIMEDLGISAYDAGGEFIGMSEYAGKLQGALKDMSAEQRNATLKTLFGSDAVRAANVLYEQGAEGIQKWEEQVNAAGYAAQTAAIMQDNLAGDIEKLGGAFDTVFIKSGSGVNDGIRGLVSGAENLVDAFGKIPGPVLSSVTGFAGIVGVTALAGGAFMTLVPKAIETWGAFRDLGTEGSKIPGTFGKVAKAAGIAAGAFVLLQAAVAIHNATAPKAKGVEEFIEDYNKLRASALDLDATFKNMEFGKSTAMAGEIDNLGSALGRLSPEFGNIRGHLQSFGATVLGAENGLPQLKREIEGMSDAMATAVEGGDIEGASKVFREMLASAERGGKGLADLTPYMDTYLDSLRNVANQYGANISEGELMVWALEGVAPAAVAAAQGAESTAAALEEIGVAANGAVTELDKFLESVFALSDGTLSVRSANRGFQESIDAVSESITKNGKSLDETTAKGRANQAALDAVAQGGKDVATAMASAKDANGNFAFTQQEVQDSLTGTYKATYDAARAFGLGKGAAADMARELLGIPKDVSVDTWISDQAESGARDTKNAVDGIPEMKNVKVVVTDEGTVSLTQEQIQGIKDRTVATTVTDEGTILTVQGGINNIEGTSETILVSDDGTATVVQGRINSVTGKMEYIRVSDGGTVAGVQAKINSIADGYAQIRVTTVHSTEHVSTGRGGKGGVTRASGGSVFGEGTETSDSIPAWLSNNEHVLSAKEVRGLGGHGEVERLRAMARIGDAPAFATGGRVGWSAGQEKAAKRDRDAAKRELDRAKRTKDEKRKTRAQKAYDAAKDEYDDARERTKRLRESEFDLRRNVKRGDIREAFTSGNGMSQVDAMFEQSNNTDLSKSQRGNLRSLGYKTESSLLKLEKEAAKVEKALDNAVARRDDLLAVQERTQGSILGAGDLGELAGQKDAYGYSAPVNKKSLLSFGNSKAASAKKLRDKVAKLQKMGFKPDMIQSAIDEWVSSGTFEIADALASMTKSEARSMNASYNSLSTYGAQTGEYLTRSMYKGGEDAARGVVNGLQSRQKNVDSAFYKLGKDAEKAFKKSLGIKSPSKSAEGWMSDVVDGSVLGVDRNTGKLESAMASLGHAGEAAFGINPEALSLPQSAEVARYAAQPAAQGQGIDYDRFALAMANVQLNANLQIDRKQAGTLVQAGQKFNGNH
jgi:TP901 family phage tail tape measure protein